MKPIQSFLTTVLSSVRNSTSAAWTWFRARSKMQQAGIAVIVLAVLGGGIYFLSSGNTTAEAEQQRTVNVASVGSLEGSGTGGSIVGSVRSVTEAKLLAQTGGTVRSIHTSVGAKVPAGFVLADLDNASEAAAVLQAEGAYDAAIAARNTQSLPDTQNAARDTYRSAYSTIDTVMQNNIDQFFDKYAPEGTRLLITQGEARDLPMKYDALDARINTWQKKLASIDTANASDAIEQAVTDTQAVSALLVELSKAVNSRDSTATPTQVAALASARASVDGVVSKLLAARTSLRSGTVSATAGANASVKSALGTLRAAQAIYEKTRIRATIGGTVNFFPIKTGQYVGAFEHVATVAQNGALEIVAYVPEDTRNLLSVGMKVSIEGNHTGTITQIAPALDPITKQIEVHIAVNAAPDLVNGQSVRITLPADTGSPAKTNSTAPGTASSTARILLPLTAVKLLPDSRAVFTVSEEGRIVAHIVTIGDVIGDRIEVTSGLTPDLRIVTDVRGLSEGQKVKIAEEPAV